MNALQQFLQAASNEAAGAVSGPVDLIGMGLRKLGVPVPRNALMSSDWMRQNGLMQDVPQSGASLAGQTFGLLSPVVAAAKAPQIARGLLQMGENAAAPRRLNPQTGAVYFGKQKMYDNAYHGTGSEFSRVNFDDAYENSKNANLGEAFWLATDDVGSNHAAAYAKQANKQGGKVKEANVFLKNPATVDAWDEAVRLANDIGQPPPQSWPEAARLLDYNGWAKDKIDDAMRAGHDALVIKRTGDAPISHDSLRLENQLSDHLAVFKPNRVRLKK